MCKAPANSGGNWKTHVLPCWGQGERETGIRGRREPSQSPEGRGLGQELLPGKGEQAAALGWRGSRGRVGTRDARLSFMESSLCTRRCSVIFTFQLFNPRNSFLKAIILTLLFSPFYRGGNYDPEPPAQTHRVVGGSRSEGRCWRCSSQNSAALESPRDLAKIQSGSAGPAGGPAAAFPARSPEVPVLLPDSSRPLKKGSLLLK